MDTPSIVKSLSSNHVIQININEPYTWSSKIVSPIYCDNRKILSHIKDRYYVIQNLVKNNI